MPQTPEPRNKRRGAFAICRDGDPIPPSLRGAILAIGNFDGVHRGHQTLIETAMQEGRSRGAPSAVLTFDPHPRRFFAPDKPLFQLTPEPAKLRILAALGLDGVFIRRFDAALAATTAADFVQRLLVAELAAAGVAVGHDFHFGKGREGTPAVLGELCRRHGLACIVVPPVAVEGEPISSSAVRHALEGGDVGRAAALLGYRWFVTGDVLHGQKLGRRLGFPTANLRLSDDCGLRHGIYAVRAGIGDGPVREGVASFGRRPTFDNGAPLLEVYLFDYAGDLYGRTIGVEFVEHVRGEERFDSAEALVAQMKRDATAARRILAAPGTGERSMIG